MIRVHLRSFAAAFVGDGEIARERGAALGLWAAFAGRVPRLISRSEMTTKEMTAFVAACVTTCDLPTRGGERRDTRAVNRRGSTGDHSSEDYPQWTASKLCVLCGLCGKNSVSPPEERLFRR